MPDQIEAVNSPKSARDLLVKTQDSSAESIKPPTLYEMFVELAESQEADRRYRNRFENTSTLKTRTRVLIEYLERFPKSAAQSAWYRRAMESAMLTIDVRRRFVRKRDTIKNVIAEVRLQEGD